jgi:DNA helicase MCM8
VFVSGPTSSAAGLTAAVGRDASTGAPSLDAGACVQADCGVCGVDEFDKMKAQHGALLEVMEQGTVTIAKAGVSATLPARCALLAAANPGGGRYDRSKTVVQNINMGAPLLSRFDLIFVLLDRADEAHDAAVSVHLLQARAGGTLPPAAAAVRLLEGGAGGAVPLAARLAPLPGDEPLPAALLRKYVSYARRFCHPTLSHEAKLVLKECAYFPFYSPISCTDRRTIAARSFYLQLRARSSSGDALPVTTRTLESLVRLTEARARAELREAATAADAEDVVELMRESLAHSVYTGADAGGFAGPSGGGGGGLKGEARRLLAAR